MESYQIRNPYFKATPRLDYLKVALDLSEAEVIHAIRQYMPQCDIQYGIWNTYADQVPHLYGHLVTMHDDRLFIVYTHHNSVGTTFIVAMGIEAELLEHLLYMVFDRGNTYMQDAIFNNYTPAHIVTVPLHRIMEYHIAVDTSRVPYENLRNALIKYNMYTTHPFKTEEIGGVMHGRSFYLGKPDSKFTKVYVYEKGKKHGYSTMGSWVRLEAQVVLSKHAEQQRAYHTNLPTLLRANAAFNQVMSEVGIG